MLHAAHCMARHAMAGAAVCISTGLPASTPRRAPAVILGGGEHVHGRVRDGRLGRRAYGIPRCLALAHQARLGPWVVFNMQCAVCGTASCGALRRSCCGAPRLPSTFRPKLWSLPPGMPPATATAPPAAASAGVSCSMRRVRVLRGCTVRGCTVQGNHAMLQGSSTLTWRGVFHSNAPFMAHELAGLQNGPRLAASPANWLASHCALARPNCAVYEFHAPWSEAKGRVNGQTHTVCL